MKLAGWRTSTSGPMLRVVSDSESYAEGAVCRPNFSGPGRRRRRNVAIAGAIAAPILLVTLIALDTPWWLRPLVAVPVGMAVISGLQVRRNTCVAHAAAGTFEDEAMRAHRVEAEVAAASRRVAATIVRDGVAAALIAGLLAAATAWIG